MATVFADIVSNLAGASAVSAADMDGDGDLDIIAADEGGDAIHWLENNGISGTVNALGLLELIKMTIMDMDVVVLHI